jgi:DNA-binding transcriptional LysR family regulator
VNDHRSGEDARRRQPHVTWNRHSRSAPPTRRSAASCVSPRPCSLGVATWHPSSRHCLDLIEEGIDVAVRIGNLPDSNLIARQVGSVRRVAVKHDTIFGMARSSAREWRFGRKRRGAVVRLSPRLLVDDVEAQVQAAKAGRGVARMLSYQVAEELAAGTLVCLLREFEPEPLPVQLVTLSRIHMTPKVRAFIDTAVKVLRDVEVIQ